MYSVLLPDPIVMHVIQADTLKFADCFNIHLVLPTKWPSFYSDGKCTKWKYEIIILSATVVSFVNVQSIVIHIFELNYLQTNSCGIVKNMSFPTNCSFASH